MTDDSGGRDELIGSLEAVHGEIETFFRERPGDALARRPEVGRVYHDRHHLASVRRRSP